MSSIEERKKLLASGNSTRPVYQNKSIIYKELCIDKKTFKKYISILKNKFFITEIDNTIYVHITTDYSNYRPIYSNVISSVSLSVLAVYAAMQYKKYDFDTKTSSLSIIEIAEITHLTTRTVKSSLKQLVEIGHIQKIKKGRTNVYELIIDNNNHIPLPVEYYTELQAKELAVYLKLALTSRVKIGTGHGKQNETGLSDFQDRELTRQEKQGEDETANLNLAEPECPKPLSVETPDRSIKYMTASEIEEQKKKKYIAFNQLTPMPKTATNNIEQRNNVSNYEYLGDILGDVSKKYK